MEKKINCTNLQCPAPVLETKKLLETYALFRVEVTVDNDAAVENVSRFLNFNGFEVGVDSDGQTSIVTGEKAKEAAEKLDSKSGKSDSRDSGQHPSSENKKILVMITSAQMGHGDDDLGTKLMQNFVKTLKEMGDDLWRLVFINHGVTLCVEDSVLLDDLNTLVDSGVSILVCGACLTHLDLLEKKAVGETTNMLDIVTSMQLADSVINL